MARRRRRNRGPTPSCELKSSGHQDRQALLLTVEQCQHKLENLLKELKKSESDAGGLVQQGEEHLDGEVSEPPEYFLCPISREIMRDPVVLSATGHTYDRSCILRWFARGNLRCPMTNRAIGGITLVPNLALRSPIMEWCQQHGVVLEPLGDEMTFKFRELIGNLHTPQQKETLEEIHALLKSDAHNMRALVEANGIEILMNLLGDPKNCVVLVLYVLRYLCINEAKKLLFRAFHGISAITKVLKQQDNLDGKTAAVDLLQELRNYITKSEWQSVVPLLSKYYKDLLKDNQLELEKQVRELEKMFDELW